MLLYRRVLPKWVKRDEETRAIVLRDGEPILQSWAFDDLDGGVSVTMGDWLHLEGRTPADLLDDRHEGYGLIRLRASDVLEIDGLSLVRKAEADDPAHGEILGNKTGGRKKQLRDFASWEIPVPR